MLSDKFPQVKGLLLDMDGVLWYDNNPIGDLPYIFNGISDLGLKVMFATNNATKTAEEYQNKLSNFGVLVKPEQIITSAEAAAKYMQQHFPAGSLVYVVGSDSLKSVVQKYGFQVAPVEDQTLAQIVLVALDVNLTFEKIRNAALLIRKGAAFIATNTDVTYPMPQGLWPGAGSIVAAIATAAGQKPFVIGKPETPMYELAFQEMELHPNQIMAVGDRLETDIAGAKKAGCLAGLVLSGIAQEEEVAQWQPGPDLVAKDLTELIYG